MGSKVIIPSEGQFRCDLEKGASQLTTYDKKFEVYFDFGTHKRENIRILISSDGIINLTILTDSKGEDGTVFYDENVYIPEHEKAVRNSFICQMNANGILRISGIFSTAPDAEDLITFSKAVKKEIISETESGIRSSQEDDSNLKRTKMQRKAKKAIEEASPEPEIADVVYRIKPLDSDFDCDISLIQDYPEFRVSADNTWRTFVNCSKYSPQDIKIEIINNRIVRISKKEEGLYERPFLKEIPIPVGCRAEDIEVTFNENGVLRLIAETEESRLLEKGVIIQKEPTPAAPTFTTIKPKIIGTGMSSTNVRTKAIVGTPWGQRIATSTVKAQAETPEFTNDKFEASVIAKDYLPEELDININDGWLTIIGKKKTNPFGESAFAPKNFTKKIQVPDDVNPEAIVCGQDSATGLIHISVKKAKQ